MNTDRRDCIRDSLRLLVEAHAAHMPTEDMIAHLRRLAGSVATVSAGAIDADEAMPSSAAYRSRFGSLLAAYRLAGITPARDYGYVQCLVATTPADQFIEEERAKETRGLAPEDVVRMEREMASPAAEFKLIEESHGRNALNLVVVVGYLRKLTENTRVTRYLAQRYPEIMTEFQKLVESRTLVEGTAGKATAE